MRYEIIDKGDLQIVHVIGHNIFFGWDNSSDYDAFRAAIDTKGMDAFVDLLIADSNTAFNLFCS